MNRGAVAFGVVNQYYWYRMRAEIGASNIHSRSPTSPRAIPATSSTSPAPAILKSSKHQAAAQKFLAFLVSTQGQEIIAALDQLRVPDRLRRDHSAAGDAFDQLQPNPITIAELGDGDRGDRPDAQAGLL